MERTLKDLRILKAEYTKENEPASITINLNKFPSIDIVITNNDGKSWGFFSDSGKCTYIGMNNQKMYGLLLSNQTFSLHQVKHINVISNNQELKRVYEETINSLIYSLKNERNLQLYGRSYFYKSYAIFNYEAKFVGMLTTNPLLFLKLADIFKPEREEISLDRLLHIIKDIIPLKLRITASSTKELIPKASCKYIRAWLKSRFPLDYISKLISYNYSPEEIEKYKVFSVYSVSANEHIFSNKKCIELLEELRNERLCGSSSYNYGFYLDYLRTYAQLPEEFKKDFPLTPQKENIKKWHDRIVLVYDRHRQAIWELKNQELTEQYLENYYPKAKKLEFEDDKYSIIACPKLSDLTVEGQVLHHCVGTYINSVSSGREYILFLRKKEQLDTPFFTVDVTPELKVRQIHGLNNCNISEELVPFINSWAKKFKLDISNCSGVYCAFS